MHGTFQKSPGHPGSRRGNRLGRGVASYLGLSVVLVFHLAPSVSGQLPSARLLNISPAGGKFGTPFEVTVSGTDLDDLKDLRFSHAGITASLKQSNRFEVSISKEVPPGIYDARALGKFGLSNPRAFAIGVRKEIAEAKNSSDTPQAIPLESTVNGRTEASGVDSFRFSARQGQRVLARCDARELDSKLEPVLELHDGTGREVARSRRGGLLDFTPAADGDFTLRLHDLTYRGGPEFFYRLSVGTFPHIDYLLPLAGGADGRTKFAVVGRNLPEGQVIDAKANPVLERLEVELAPNSPGVTKAFSTMPAQAGLDLFEYRVRQASGLSDGAWLRFPAAPVITERESNHWPATAQVLTAPCEVAGTFSANGDRDWFSLAAKKGEVFWIEVISHRLGMATDPFVLVQRAGTNGATEVLELNDSPANLGGAEFNTTHRDPSGKFEVKEDGTYLLQVRDLFNQPPRSPALAYQLVIRTAAPDFRLVALPVTPLPVNKDAKNLVVSTATLRRGETQPFKVLALRRDGFDGAIELSVENLPKGIAATPTRIEAGQNSTLLFLHAADDGSAVAGTFTIRGTASVGGTNLLREARSANVVWGVGDPATEALFSRVNAHASVSVMDEAGPLRIEVAEGQPIEAVAGGKLKLPLRVIRDGEFTATLKLKPVGVPALESAKELTLDPKATNAVYEIDLGAQKLAPGRYSFALQSLATGQPMKADKAGKKSPGKDATFTLYSTPIVLNVTAAVAKTNSPAK